MFVKKDRKNGIFQAMCNSERKISSYHSDRMQKSSFDDTHNMLRIRRKRSLNSYFSPIEDGIENAESSESIENTANIQSSQIQATNAHKTAQTQNNQLQNNRLQDSQYNNDFKDIPAKNIIVEPIDYKRVEEQIKRMQSQKRTNASRSIKQFLNKYSPTGAIESVLNKGTEEEEKQITQQIMQPQTQIKQHQTTSNQTTSSQAKPSQIKQASKQASQYGESIKHMVGYSVGGSIKINLQDLHKSGLPISEKNKPDVKSSKSNNYINKNSGYFE